MQRLHQLYKPFTERQLVWEDVLAIADQLGAPVQLRRTRQDAVLTRLMGRTKIVVSDRVHQPTWGVFCVMHELSHHLVHPGPREFYLGSPGWMSKTESQANALALLALVPPQPARPAPRLLDVTLEKDAVTLHIGLTGDGSGRLTSKRLHLQRYA